MTASMLFMKSVALMRTESRLPSLVTRAVEQLLAMQPLALCVPSGRAPPGL
jgi:hypothetical protein